MFCLVLECSAKANGGYCQRVGKKCWCYYKTPTLPYDVCGYAKDYSGRYYSIGRLGTITANLPSTIITYSCNYLFL